jgi:virulence-associated protein VapD
VYALAFDLVVAEAQRRHPVGATRAYYDIRDVLTEQFGFEWTQGSLYVLRNEDMSILFRAIQALMQLAWFPPSVRDIRAFRVEQWSDFTATVKGAAVSSGRGRTDR